MNDILSLLSGEKKKDIRERKKREKWKEKQRGGTRKSTPVTDGS